MEGAAILNFPDQGRGQWLFFGLVHALRVAEHPAMADFLKRMHWTQEKV